MRNKKHQKATGIIAMIVSICLTLIACGSTTSDTGSPNENMADSESANMEATDKPEVGDTSGEETEDIEEPMELMVPRLSEAALTNTISDEIKAKAESMPKATYQSLPDWNGTTVVNKEEVGWIPEGLEPIYSEETIDELVTEGFNFIRVPLDTRYFFLENSSSEDVVGPIFNGSSKYVNTEQLANVDELISWCIDKGVHVCFDVHSTPGGYMIGGDEEASRELLFTEGSEEEQIFFDFWEFFSQRYADISPNALSFNLYNEPPNFVSDEQYTAFIKKTMDIVTPANPDRIIFVDMLEYATVPVEGLVGEKIVQAFHCYQPYDFTHSGFDNMDYESGEANRRSEHREIVTYPLQAIYPGIHKGYIVNGNFPAGTRLTMKFSGGVVGVTCILKDSSGDVIWSQKFDESLLNEKGHESFSGEYFSVYEDGSDELMPFEFTLESDTKELAFSIDNADWWLDMNEFIIETEDYKAKLLGQWIEGVEENLPGTRATIDEKGIVTITNSDAAQYNQGRNLFEDIFGTYKDFSDETGTTLMLQEFGDTVYTEISCSKQFYDDILSVCDDLGFNWVHWTLDSGDFSYIAPVEQYRRHGANYEETSPGSGRYVCTELREVFQKHME